MGVGNDPLFLYIQEKDMEIKIFTTNGCVWCVRMKELMARANVTYTEVNWQELSGDEQVALTEEYPEIKSFPAAVIDGQFYSGLVPVAKKFLDDGLVSAPQK